MRSGKELSNVTWEPDDLPDLFAVAPLTRTNAWAVGGVDSSSTAYGFSPIVAHWNGRSWRHVHTPFERKDAILNDIVALSPSDLWAVGSRLIVRYSC
jgi:hypothetical protein